MIKNLVGIVVTYNPNITTLLLNLEKICESLVQVIIIDNGSANFFDIRDNLLQNKKIRLIRNKENRGIATALNQGFSIADSLGFTYAISFDQDSHPLDNMINDLWFNIQNNEEKLQIGMVGPKYIDSNIIEIQNFQNIGMLETTVVITSGCISNIKTILSIGGFLDKLFIDYVDFEICLRLKSKGYSNFIMSNTFLKHRLGNSVEKKFLWFKLIVTHHSSERRFFLFRNKYYIWRSYFYRNSLWVIRDVLSSIKTIILILLYENHKIKTLNSIYQGFKSAKYL